MSCAPSMIIVLLGTLGADLPTDYELPPPPGPFVGVARSAEGPGFRSGTPLVATTYFYWYDATAKSHIRDGDGTDALTEHPPTLEGFSFKNVDWHAEQLEDMVAAGVDVVMPVYWGTPCPEPVFAWSNEGLPKLVAARERLLQQHKTPPAIGMFYDTSTLRHNRGGRRVDLRAPAGRLWFYGTIRNFFSLIPPRHRATVDGKPLVFLYSHVFAKSVDAELFPAVRRMFRADFGTDLYLVKMRTWPGKADSEYQWGAALWPKIMETAAIGPGYDHSAVPGRAPLVRKRLGGGFYRFSWEKLLAMNPDGRPWLVHLETWNEFHEGTQICHSAEYGRKYIELTRRYAEMFRARKRIAQPFVPPAPKIITAGLEKFTGLQIAPKPGGDGPIIEKTVQGRPAWSTTKNRVSAANRYMYFNVDDFFLFSGDELMKVTIVYFDAGPKEFRFEYDSNDPSLSGIARAFCLGRRQPITGSNTWKEVTFVIPHARFGNGSNGSDFRLACVDGELSISRVSICRP